MAYELLKFSGPVELAHAAASRWLELLGERKNSSVPYSVALSGGRVARDFFTELTRQSAGHRDLWKGVHFFWADERCVPPDDPESNYGAARQLFLVPANIPENQIHRLRGEDSEALALRAAVADIENVVPVNGKGEPVFDMVFLGMGEDGHVASLFPGERVEDRENTAAFRAVIAVKPPPRRLTVGYGVLESAREVWVMVSGKGKEQALRESLAPQGKTPMARVIRARERTMVLTDVSPAGQL